MVFCLLLDDEFATFEEWSFWGKFQCRKSGIFKECRSDFSGRHRIEVEAIIIFV